jgi:hypothetical protein
MADKKVITQSDLRDWLAGELLDSEKLSAIDADLSLEAGSQTQSWLRKAERPVAMLDEIGTPEGMRRWRERLRQRRRTDTAGQDIDDFVAQEVLRQLSKITNPSALLGRQELRTLRDRVVESAHAANLLATAEDNRALHTALVWKIRPIRRENAQVTSKSSLVKTSQKAAEKLLHLLKVEDQLLADLRADEEFAHVGLWYQLAEDAALSDEEIAALWEEDPAIVRASIARERAGLEVARDEP